jgi:hypothetical protein
MAGNSSSGRIVEGYTFEREEAIRAKLLAHLRSRCSNCLHEPSMREVAKNIGVKYDSLYRFTVGRQLTMDPSNLKRIEDWVKAQVGFIPAGKGKSK